MLDRKTIKKDVKGILGGESRGPVFLATLISFIIVLVYFGAVWVIAQFYPISMSELEAISTWSQSQVLIAPQTDAMQTYNAAMAIVTNALTAFGRTLSSIGSINLWAWLLELILLLPLGIGIQKFMLRVIRLKNPGASTVLRGYTAPYFFRSIIMPFWKQICYLGWRIILFIILCGLMAGAGHGAEGAGLHGALRRRDRRGGQRHILGRVPKPIRLDISGSLGRVESAELLADAV